MGKMFEKMYIGNPNKKDLTKRAIEKQSRFSLFFTVVRTRGMNLLGLNLLYAIFLLPTFIVIYMALYQYGVDGPEMGFDSVFMYMYFLFPCMIIACPGTLGFTNVLHRWANDEHAWFSDFWTGIKKNWKQGLIVTVINYVVFMLFIYCTWFYIALPQSEGVSDGIKSLSSISMFIAYLLIGCLFVYFMIHMYVFPFLVRYKLTIKEIYKYSLILAFKNFAGTVACIIFTALVIFVMLFMVPQTIMMLLMMAVVPVFVYLVLYVYIGKVFNRNVFIAVKDY